MMSWCHCHCHYVTVSGMMSLSVEWRHCQWNDVTVMSLSVEWRHCQLNDVTVTVMTLLSVEWCHCHCHDITVSWMISLPVEWRLVMWDRPIVYRTFTKQTLEIELLMPIANFGYQTYDITMGCFLELLWRDTFSSFKLSSSQLWINNYSKEGILI